MTREAKIGDVIADHFSAFEDDGFTKRSGLAGGSFTVTSYVDGVLAPLVLVTISEIGVTGEYKISFTPSALGFYSIQILIDFNKDIWEGEYQVVSELTTTVVTQIQLQADKIDLIPTLGPAAVTVGSLMDRMMNKNNNRTYNQGTDSLEAIKDRMG